MILLLRSSIQHLRKPELLVTALCSIFLFRLLRKSRKQKSQTHNSVYKHAQNNATALKRGNYLVDNTNDDDDDDDDFGSLTAFYLATLPENPIHSFVEDVPNKGELITKVIKAKSFLRSPDNIARIQSLENGDIGDTNQVITSARSAKEEDKEGGRSRLSSFDFYDPKYAQKEHEQTHYPRSFSERMQNPNLLYDSSNTLSRSISARQSFKKLPENKMMSGLQGIDGVEFDSRDLSLSIHGSSTKEQESGYAQSVLSASTLPWLKNSESSSASDLSDSENSVWIYVALDKKPMTQIIEKPPMLNSGNASPFIAEQNFGMETPQETKLPSSTFQPTAETGGSLEFNSVASNVFAQATPPIPIAAPVLPELEGMRSASYQTSPTLAPSTPRSGLSSGHPSMDGRGTFSYNTQESSPERSGSRFGSPPAHSGYLAVKMDTLPRQESDEFARQLNSLDSGSEKLSKAAIDRLMSQVAELKLRLARKKAIELLGPSTPQRSAVEDRPGIAPYYDSSPTSSPTLRHSSLSSTIFQTAGQPTSTRIPEASSQFGHMVPLQRSSLEMGSVTFTPPPEALFSSSLPNSSQSSFAGFFADSNHVAAPLSTPASQWNVPMASTQGFDSSESVGRIWKAADI